MTDARTGAAGQRARVLVGVLAGGRGERMGGRDKAALPAPGSGEPLLLRLLGLAARLGVQCVVVGGQGAGGAPRVADQPPGIGPIGGLSALLAHAGERPVIALACDLPYLGADLLARLADTPSAAPVLAARDPETGKWQPLFARYDAPRLLPELRAAVAAGTRSLQTFLATVEVDELPLDAGERAQLRDWDVPADMDA